MYTVAEKVITVFMCIVCERNAVVEDKISLTYKCVPCSSNKGHFCYILCKNCTGKATKVSQYSVLKNKESLVNSFKIMYPNIEELYIFVTTKDEANKISTMSVVSGYENKVIPIVPQSSSLLEIKENVNIFSVINQTTVKVVSNFL